jgi:translation initiation factor IF-2
VEADREGPVWRGQEMRDRRGPTFRSKDEQQPGPFRFRSTRDTRRPYPKADRSDGYLSRASRDRTSQGGEAAPAMSAPFKSAQQLFKSGEDRFGRTRVADVRDRPHQNETSNTGNRSGLNAAFDTGDRSGLDALVNYSAEVNRPPSRFRNTTEEEFRMRRMTARDAWPRRETKMNTTRHVPEAISTDVFGEAVPGLPTIMADLPRNEGEEDLFASRKERHRGRFLEMDEEKHEEEGRRARGRFQSNLEEPPQEPQIAPKRADPRLQKKAARRASSARSDYDFDPDEEFLLGRTRKKKSKDKSEEGTPARTPIQLPEFISVENLATALRVRAEEFIGRMEEMGFDRPRHDHILDAETSGLIAGEFNFEPTYSQGSQVQDLIARPFPEDVSSLPPRPPIVTIMGHVDHGKTTILDWLRKSSVVESEHGGITQHIGAFSVTMPGGKQITFLDTPGHAAFLDMRRRGANVTDIVILVVAADDSVKPQTLEAIKHATDAKVPMIVAMNKVDKEDADVDRVKQDLARHGVTVEDYGGEVQAIPVSGKFGKGMEELEEATVTLSELLDHRAKIDGPVEGWIIESKVTTAGRVATVLVRRGTLRAGDIIVAGTTWARVRTLRNDAGALVDEALPGTPVQIDGWRGDDPIAGWEVLQAEDEDQAKDVVELRQDREEFTKLAGDTAAINASRAEEAEARAKVLAWEAEQEWASKKASRRPKDNAGWVEGKASSGPKQIHFVVKADVSGSVEAVVNSVSALGNNEIAANVIRSGVGVINESDIQHLSSSGEVGYLISFNQPVDGNMSRLAGIAGLEILDHNIIYNVTDVVKEKLSAELPPLITQRVVGEAEVGKVFEIGVKKGKTRIAGCKISNGIITREKKIRVLRRMNVIYDGKGLNQILVI